MKRGSLCLPLADCILMSRVVFQILESKWLFREKRYLPEE